jgi:membrane protein implicated in regulation of membrane protease activity
MSNEAWLWFWIGAAVFLAIAEIFTAGFFMLPFAVGAAAAAALAYADVGEIPQLVVFLVVSVIALFILRRFVVRGDEKQHPVGANRFVGQQARVIEAIDPAHALGRVRLETEMWRATSDSGPIPEGVDVKVVEVRGTRLVVAPLDKENR